MNNHPQPISNDSAISDAMVATSTLRDIEPPLAPSWDVLQWLIDLLPLGFFLVILAGLWWWLTRTQYRDRRLLWAPIQLRWQLWRMRRQFKTQQSAGVHRAQARCLFDGLTQLVRVLQQNSSVDSHVEVLTLLSEAESIRQRSAHAAFSNQSVSRETLTSLMQSAEVLVNKTLSLRFIKVCVQQAIKQRGRR